MKRSSLSRRSRLNRGTKRLERRTPLRGRPSKRARPSESLATWCEAAVPEVCEGRAVHRHHKLRRSAGGSDDKANTLDACSADHRAIHEHPEWAARHGLLVLRGIRGPVIAGCPLTCEKDHRHAT